MPKKKRTTKGMTELERLRERVEYLEAENAEMFGIGPRQSED